MLYRPTTQLYRPNTAQVRAYGRPRHVYEGLGKQMGLPPEPPPGFQVPNPQEYGKGLIRGVDTLGTDWVKTNMDPPIAAAVIATRTAIEGGLGKPLTQLIDLIGEGKFTLQEAATLTEVIGDLVLGALDMVSKIAGSMKGMDAAVSAIPIIGQIIGAVLAIVIEAIEIIAAYEQAKVDLEIKLHEQLNQMCRQKVAADMPFATGPTVKDPEGEIVCQSPCVTPADLFRRLAFTYSTWHEANIQAGGTPGRSRSLPFDAASMLLMLCGGETQGFGMNRARWRQLVDRGRQTNSKIGIPASTQRKMWKLIKGIMATSTPPITDHPLGDSGRTLMPFLADIVRMEYNRGTWDDRFATILSDEVTEQLGHRVQVTPPMAAAPIVRQSNCRGQEHGVGRHVNLGPTLVVFVANFQAGLWGEFWDESKQDWNIAPRMAEEFTAMRGRLVLSDALSIKTNLDLRGLTRTPFLSRNSTKAILAGLAAVGAYAGIRKLGIKF